MSLRARLLVGMVALVAIGLTIAAVVTYEEQRSFLHARVDQQVLSATGPMFGALRVNRSGAPFPPRRTAAGFPGRGLAGSRPGTVLPPATIGELISPQGTVLRRRTFSYNGSVTPIPVLPAHYPVSRLGQRTRLFSIQTRAGAEYVAAAFAVNGDTAVVAVPLREVNDTLNRLISVEVLVGLGVILALIALGWFVIRLGLRPLERIGRVASEIAGGDLSRRVTPAEGRTEVGRLGASLNEMLAQIELAFEDRRVSEERLRNFLADASHELRTPLASIRGYAELFRMGAIDDPPALARAMARIEAESERMGTLVEDLLALARLDETSEAQRVEIDLRELAEHALQDTRVIAPGRRITLTAPDRVVVPGDPDGLRQLLTNLLRNAVIHTPTDTPIEVALIEAGDWVALEVRDHGPGLPAGEAEQLFERFWRAEGGRSRGKGGAGLGLAIVRTVASLHGGRVRAENASGGGARFRVELPALSRISASSHESLSRVADSALAMSDIGGKSTPGQMR